MFLKSISKLQKAAFDYFMFNSFVRNDNLKILI